MKTDYTYAAAYVKSLENNMLTEEDYAAILNAADVGEIVNILRAKGYGGENVFKMLEDERKKTWSLCCELCPGEPQINVLMYPAEFHNIKAILKSVMSGRDWRELVYEPFLTEPNEIANAFMSGKFSGLDDKIAPYCAEAYRIYKDSGDGRKVDMYLDKAELEKMCADSTGFVHGYVEILILCADLRAFLRCGGLEFMREALIESNLINIESLASDRKSKEEILRSEGYKEAYDLYSRSPIEFERWLDDNVTDYIRGAGASYFEFDAVAAYLVGKLNEIKNIRIAAYGKMNGVQGEKIKERLRKTYV